MRKPECVNRAEGRRDGICLNKMRLATFKRRVGPDNCSQCPDVARMIKVPLGSNVAPVSETPSETPQKPHTEPPEITPLGTLIYARTAWEPPPSPPGYRARSSDPKNDDAWILDPIDVMCKHLELKVSDVGACGYHRIAKKCKLVQSFIGQRTCETCPRRE